MSTRKSNTARLKSQRPQLQPVEANPYVIQMGKLGLDWISVDQMMEEYLDSADDGHLVLTIIVLQRLLNLVRMRGEAPESMENFLPLLIDRLYRGTYHCEDAASEFAGNADRALREKQRTVARRIA